LGAVAISSAAPGAFSSSDTQATAAFSGDEVVFSGPNGGTTTTSLNLSLNGSSSATSGRWDAAVQVGLTGSQGNASGNGGLTDSPVGFVTSGLLAGFTGPSGSFASPTISIVSGEHVLVSLSLTVSADCGAIDLPRFFGPFTMREPSPILG
jgi:hypothetical protein